ncbi:DUF4238 domain-containing protein [Brucella anthropi]|uniref:DUF4238 domain-containing protein n=1 Tax=Brucella anthropi TaxID=529 RepID=UPI001CFE0B75|nr:DUF4238 domain-containing protein [Brucella anthropi]
MNLADKHHYVPKFYTKQWATNGLLTIYQGSEDGLSVRKGAPKSTGYLSRLYSMKNVPVEDAADIEREFFAPADNLAERAMHALRNGRLIYGNNFREAWAQFVMGLLIRCPEDLDLLRGNWLNYLVEVPPHWETIYNQTRKPGDPTTLAEKLKTVSPAAEESSMFRAFLHLFNHQNVLNFVKSMRWFVLDVTAANWSLLTSDRPVVRTNGLQNPGGHIALAIGPTKLFCGALDIQTEKNIRRITPNALVRTYNRQVVEGAARFVYSLDRDQDTFITRWFGKNPQQRIVAKFFERQRTVKILDKDGANAATANR